MNINPYNDATLNVMYNQLFCDIPELYNNHAAGYPWDVLFNNKSRENRNHSQQEGYEQDLARLLIILILAINI